MACPGWSVRVPICCRLTGIVINVLNMNLVIALNLYSRATNLNCSNVNDTHGTLMCHTWPFWRTCQLWMMQNWSKAMLDKFVRKHICVHADKKCDRKVIYSFKCIEVHALWRPTGSCHRTRWIILADVDWFIHIWMEQHLVRHINSEFQLNGDTQ